jgi:branched-chain amino acid transport system permease protein
MTVATQTSSRSAWGAVTAWAASPAAATVAVIAGLLVVQRVAWPAPAGILVRGVIIGGLTALISFGIALVYRANRIVNFAQGDLGLVPTVVAVVLIASVGLPYFAALGLGLAVAVGLGALVQFAVIRRFASAPRLILTVATLGLAQLLAALALALPGLANNAFPGTFEVRTPPQSFPDPFEASFEVSPIIFHGNDIIALVAVVVCVVALAAFFRFTNLGIAVRASAESAQREAEALGPMLLRIREATGASLSIIEHDMPLVRHVSDEILALDLGRVVVRDRPDVVLHDPRVVASYLGTSDVTTTRSGTAGLLAEAPQGD